MKRKYPIKEHAIAFTLWCIALSPFILLWTVFGVGSVKAVEACQRIFCDDALEDNDDVELADETIHEERDDDNQSEGGLDGDSMRLMEGHTK